MSGCAVRLVDGLHFPCAVAPPPPLQLATAHSVARAIKDRFNNSKKEMAPFGLSQDRSAREFITVLRGEQEADQLATEGLPVEKIMHAARTFRGPAAIPLRITRVGAGNGTEEIRQTLLEKLGSNVSAISARKMETNADGIGFRWPMMLCRVNCRPDKIPDSIAYGGGDLDASVFAGTSLKDNGGGRKDAGARRGGGNGQQPANPPRQPGRRSTARRPEASKAQAGIPPARPASVDPLDENGRERDAAARQCQWPIRAIRIQGWRGRR
jgi:hypothetical protein